MVYDILIVGGGPAGMTAALYGRRAGHSVLLLEKGGFGGQMALSPRVANYPAAAEGSGAALADAMLTQILALGAECEPAEIVRAERVGELVRLTADDGTTYEGRTLILAVGAEHRHLGLAGEEELTGAGISFCAVCDGAFYAGRDVVVLGGGDSALQEALLLSETCRRVTVCHRRELTGEQSLQDALRARENVTIRTHVNAAAFHAEDGVLTGVTLRAADGREELLPCDGVFEAVGQVPATAPFAALLETDDAGYAAVGEDCRTGDGRVFVAGDCRRKPVRQIATAVADGAVAALAASDRLRRA